MEDKHYEYIIICVYVFDSFSADCYEVVCERRRSKRLCGLKCSCVELVQDGVEMRGYIQDVCTRGLTPGPVQVRVDQHKMYILGDGEVPL